MVVVVGVGGGIAGIAQLHLQSNVDAGISLQGGEKQSQCARNEQDSFHVLGLTECATDCEKEPVTTNVTPSGNGSNPYRLKAEFRLRRVPPRLVYSVGVSGITLVSARILPRKRK